MAVAAMRLMPTFHREAVGPILPTFDVNRFRMADGHRMYKVHIGRAIIVGNGYPVIARERTSLPKPSYLRVKLSPRVALPTVGMDFALEQTIQDWVIQIEAVISLIGEPGQQKL